MKNLLYLILVGMISLGSCKNNLELTPGLEEFNVSVNSTTVKVNEEVNFQFEGNPDIITFYSGELYKEYKYREGRIIRMDEADLSFTTQLSNHLRPQENQFAVMASSDFNGNYSDYSNIAAATWVDITDRFTLASVPIDITPSGVVDISDLIDPGKPLYIGFKYTVYAQEEVDPAFNRPRQWGLQNFNFVGNTVAGPVVLGTMSTSGFTMVYQHPDLPNNVQNLASIIRLRYISPDSPVHTEYWAVSKAFETGEIDRGPDRPQALKADQNPPLTNYIHKYEKAGVYKAFFIAMNANVNGSKEVVREVTINVID